MELNDGTHAGKNGESAASGKGSGMLRLLFNQRSRGAWIAGARTTVRRLRDLSTATEGDFLSLGDSLQQFSGRSRSISDLSSSLAAMMSGTEITTAMEKLRQIITQVKNLDTGSKQGTEILRTILGRIEEMHRPLIGFARIVRNLRVLCSFIKIESARLVSTDTGFTQLSADVAKLAATIETKSADLFAQSMQLSSRVKDNLDKIEKFETSKHGQALFILDGTGQYLNSLTEMHLLSSATVQDVAARWGQISADIGEVVSSLQFHDITRQRIEHVGESLVEVADGLGNVPAMSGYRGLMHLFPAGRLNRAAAPVASWSEVLKVTVSTCEVQRAQLSHAGSEVVSAVRRIVAGLDDIARQVGEMCEETRKLVITADTSGTSFLSFLEKGFSALIGSIAQYNQINDQLTETMNHAAQTIGTMSTFISDIEKIGIEIRMIALNACVRAAHVGEHGAALGVLADTIHELSVDTTHHADIISSSLKLVIASAEALTGSVNCQGGREGSTQDRFDAEIAPMVESLRRIDEATVELLNRIDDQGRSLSNDITQTSGAIQVHDQIDREIGLVTADLDRLLKDMRRYLPASEQKEQTAHLDQLAERYTMKQEREVHRQIIGIGGGVQSAAVTGTVVKTASGKNEGVTGDEESLGDNVELF